MIRVVGANPAMDRVSIWPTLRLGEVNRALAVSVVPGGKGLNVARAVVRLGGRAVAYGFLGGPVGEALAAMISADGVVDRHTRIHSGTRVCFIVVEPEPKPGRSSVLNEPGPVVSAGEIEQLLATLREDSRPDDVLIISGSLPDSVPPVIAADIVDIGRKAGARTLLDIHGAALRAAVAARPWMVKCNRDELAGLAHEGPLQPGVLEELRSRQLDVVAAEMLELRKWGIDVVIVTLGPDGALLADDDGVIHARAPQVEAVNATGSGDLLLAGLATGLERGQSPREALPLGTACGTAGATHLTPELPPDFDAAAWTSRIDMEVVEVDA